MTYLLTSRSKSFSFDVGMYGGLLTMTSNGKYCCKTDKTSENSKRIIKHGLLLEITFKLSEIYRPYV
jgi:hypothetical protein